MADWSLCACAWCVSMCGVCERPLDHSRFGVYTSQSSRSRGEAGACNACGHVCRERWLLVGVRRNMQVREVSERRSEVRASSDASCRWYGTQSPCRVCVAASKEWTSPDDTFHKKTPRADN